MIYTPSHFRAADEATALRIMREHPFATLITTGDADEPQVSYLPLLLDQGALIGHMARANPHWQRFAGGRTLALFHGPHAFISPRWYVDPAQHVPTWNYAVAHVHGRVELLDAAGTRDALLALTRAFEGDAWAPTEDKLARLLAAIVGFRIAIERIQTKVKMSQNRAAADRAKLRGVLAQSPRADERALRDWIPSDD